MLIDYLLRLCVHWLDRKGLSSVAAVVETRLASSGDAVAVLAVAKRALARGDHAAALVAIAPAISKAPKEPALWGIQGTAYRLAKKFDEARLSYEVAIKLDPRHIVAINNLGELDLACGFPDDALTRINQAIAIDPSYMDARVNQLAVLIELGRYAEAKAAAESLIATHPLRPEPYGSLGNIYVSAGQIREAVKLYRKALELRPDYAEAHFNLAILLGEPEDQKSAIGYLESQIAQNGDACGRLSLLAAAYKAAGRIDESVAMCNRVIQRQPDNVSALVTLAACICDGGAAVTALRLFERVVAIDESQFALASTAIFTLNYIGDISRIEIFQKHVAWAARYEKPLRSGPTFDEHNQQPDRKLRIGYVSGDFSSHPVGFLLRDILVNHDKEEFEVYCFAIQMRSDEVSVNVQAAAHLWVDALLLSVDELAASIRNSKIDVLIDLSGHTALHRLLSFALRPAPVQATWLGYFHSTGMTSIDYFITDPYTSPGTSGQLFSEIPVHLPHTRFCFGAPVYAPEVAETNVLARGAVTFGSFNRLAKLDESVLDAWCLILQALPDCRLLVKAAVLSEASVCNQLSERFARRGIEANRLVLRTVSPHREMLEEYGEVDIALDTFPFNGGMTTLEALWMGVPVVTIAGDTVVSRQSFSALANIGLADELAFPDVDAYVAGAIALAQNPKRLAELRHELRPRMEASPLRQSKQFTKDLEALYRRMWVAWCEGRKLESDVVGCPVQVTVN